MNTTCRGILPTWPDSIKINDHTIELDRKEELRLNDEPQEVIDRVFTVTNEWDEVYTITFREYVNEPTLLYWIENEDETLIEHKSVKFNCRGDVINLDNHFGMVLECLKAQGFLLSGSRYDVYR